MSSLADSELYWLISTPVLLVLLTVGLFLVAGGQVGKRKRNTGATGLFLAMVGIMVLIVELPEFVSLKSRKIPGLIPWQQFSLLSGIQLARCDRFACRWSSLCSFVAQGRRID